MTLSNIYFTGFNGFGQFSEFEEDFSNKFIEWKIKLPETDIAISQICATWNYNGVAINNSLYLFGLLNGQFGQNEKLNFNDTIIKISGNDNFCLVLLKNYELWKFVVKTRELVKLNFLIATQCMLKRKSIFPDEIENECETNAEVILDICCGHTFSVAVTSQNAIYNIPTKIHTFPKHLKLVKVACGAEHALLLTSNGDVYAFGSASRGQLGLGKLSIEESPILIEALSGIKITDIATGAWHSTAVSSFGDLYMWGWNVNGQMGRPMHKVIPVSYDSGRTEMVRHKLPSVFATPEIVNLPIPSAHNDSEDNAEDDNLDEQYFVTNVYSGVRHTLVKTKCGKLLGCGWNKYGQLGLEDTKTDVIKFENISVEIENFSNIICGNWCTIIY